MCTQEDCVVIWEKERVLGEVAYGLGIVCKFSSCTWLKLLSQFTNNLQNAKHQKKTQNVCKAIPDVRNIRKGYMWVMS